MLLVAKKPKRVRRSVTYRLPEDMLLQLDKLTEKSFRTVTTEVQLAIEEHLRKAKLWPPPKLLFQPATD